MTSSRQILFITGLSGAGISTALKSLEDFGYEVFDNFPLTHVESLLSDTGYEYQPIAFGLDSRTRAYSPDRLLQLSKEIGASILFLTSSNKSIQKRFSETRRKHPLAKDRTVADGIVYERQWLDVLVHNADLTIDTSELSVHDLKKLIEANFVIDNDSNNLSVSVMSFGFKNGVPREVDMVLDVRFLKNPHWDAELKSLTGQNLQVQHYINSDENCEIFYKKITDLITFLLPQYINEGKKYFTIAFGCTGGKHRSVYLTERLASYIETLDYTVTIRHRDMPMV